MTTFDSGRRAEAVAADFLQTKGCAIVAQNWRTRWCEIDVIAERGAVIYFCEVKYRRSAKYGAGLDYITPRKLEQMRFAAEIWVSRHRWAGAYQLCAIEVSGAQFRVTAVLKDL
jgi:uncharacterized protein (TIGR00252 family)